MFNPPAIPPGPVSQIARVGGLVKVTPAGAVSIAPLAGQSTTIASGALIFGAAASKVVPGATSFSVRNNADSADNLLVTDAGVVTFRAAVGGITTLTATTLAGAVSTAAQPAITSVGTLTGITTSGTLTFSAAASVVVPGATSFSIRDTGNAADNLLVSDAGVVTLRNSLTVTLGTVTVSTPAHTSTATWNDGAVTFKHIVANVTNTASAAASLLVDLQVGSVSKFSVGKDGSLIGTGTQNALGAVATTVLFNITTAFTSAGAAQGLRFASVMTPATGNPVQAFSVSMTAGSGSENITIASCFRANLITKGTSGTITDLVGFYGSGQTAVATNAWNFYAAGASTGGTALNGAFGATLGAITNPSYAFYSTVTWNDAADTFTHIFANITDTASAAGSLLIDLQVGGASKFSVSKSGLVLTVASAAGGAGFRLPHGAAPTAPVDGDVWTTTAGVFARVNGVTVGPLS